MLDFRKMQKEKVFGELNKFVDNLIEKNNYLIKRLEEYDKDEQVAKLLKENQRLRDGSLHNLTEKENEEYKAFKEQHWNSCQGNTRFILEGTGMGTSVTLQCTKCNRTKNITDYSNW